MRIIHATPVYSPALGGVERYVQNIAEGMARRGHGVQVVTADGNSSRRLTNTDEKNLLSGSVQVFRLNSYGIFPKSQYTISPQLTIEIANASVDIIHAHLWGMYPCDIATLIGQARNIPVIINPYYVPMGTKRGSGVITRLMGHRRYEVSRVIAISEAERDWLVDMGFDKQRIGIVYPGVDLDEFAQRYPNPLLKYHVHDAPAVLCVGRVAHSKRIDLLIEAAPIILEHQPETWFFIVGPNEGALNTLRQLAITRGVNHRIVFTGPLSRQELISFYQHATVLAFPSHFEAFGIVAIEAMAAGLPVVGCRRTISYIVDDGQTGLLFTENTAADLADCVIRLLDSQDLRLTLTKNAMQKVSDNFTWDNSLQCLEKIYQNVLHG